MTDTSLRVKIASREMITLRVVHLSLINSTSAPLPRFEAGAHIDLHLGKGLVRQYSLLNDPADHDCYEIAVLRDASSRGGSEYVHASLNVGDELTISAPRNHFPLTPAPHSLLLAGGIGITPLLAMSHQLHHDRKSFELHAYNRNREAAAFLAQSDSMAFGESCHWHFDDESKSRIGPKDLLQQAASTTHLYVCGPAGFMDHVIESAKAMGWADERIHFEYFGQSLSNIPSDGFVLRLDRSNLEVRVSESESVIEALQRIGVEIPFSCEQGVCGTCVLKVLEGEPDHRDMYFTDAEKARNDRFTPCCSRARGDRLVIDL